MSQPQPIPYCKRCEFFEVDSSTNIQYCNKSNHRILNNERRQGQKAPDWCPFKTNLKANKKRRKIQGLFYI